MNIKYEDAPNSWKGRCNNVTREEGYSPCPICHKFPFENGDDYCIASLGKVINACCGHGEEGYIQFDNGVIIRGYFTIEKDKVVK